MKNELSLIEYSEADLICVDISMTVSGVYFLFLEKELVYIGLGMNVFSRIFSHISNGVKFDKASFLPVDNYDKAELIEAKLIWKLRPKYNKHIKNPTKIKNKQSKKRNGKKPNFYLSMA